MRRAVFAFALVACSRSPAEPTSSAPPAPASSTASAPAPASVPAAPASVAAASIAATPPLLWTDPPKWPRRPPSTPARAAQYVVPRAGGDGEDGECVVMTFGSRQGGTVEDNVKRWTGQFQGGPPPVRRTSDVHGMRVTRVEAAGTYAAMAPGIGTPPTVYPGWRLVGAIVEAPSGLWFFKMTGPDATVKDAGPAFDQMIASARANSS